jgi:hypothetical protein
MGRSVAAVAVLSALVASLQSLPGGPSARCR